MSSSFYFWVFFDYLQMFVPIFALYRDDIRHGIALRCVLPVHPLRRLPVRSIRVQAQNDPPQMGVLLQVGVQRPLIQAVQCDCVAPHFRVQREKAHKVNGRFEHRYPVQTGRAEKRESGELVASGDPSFETGAVPIAGAAFTSGHRLAGFVSADKDTVVIPGFFI